MPGQSWERPGPRLVSPLIIFSWQGIEEYQRSYLVDAQPGQGTCCFLSGNV